jgi:DNA-binding NtrC family response regulator
MPSQMAKVLLVDDEPDITTTLKHGLELQGFDVVSYNDPLKALSDYTKNHYDLHVFDVRMPGISGFNLARQIWLLDPMAEVCFFTSFEIYEDEAKTVFKDFKKWCFIKKPISPSALAEHIKTHLTAKNENLSASQKVL